MSGTIRAEGVEKVFHPGEATRCEALRDVSFEIPLGETTVFTGPSGSGKTTLLTLVGCMARPTRGRIHLEDREITGLPERFLGEIRRRRFGFVFQHFNLLGNLSALENVMLPALPTGAPRRELEERARALLERFGVGGKELQRADHLSGGERQRVAVARALVNRPDILIADEPTAHLDTSSGERLMALFAELRGRGVTVLLASHDPLVVSSPSVDRVIPLRDGRLSG